jgi:hypothetical protein
MTRLRAAVLAVRMSLDPVLGIDVMRFLRVPAIVWVMRASRARFCREKHARGRHRHFTR